MDLLKSDLTKFRRSHVWTVIVLVPLIAVAIGTANYSANSAKLGRGWESLFSQILLFYGLLFMTAGIAVIAATAWRFEHRGHNWLALMTSTRSTGGIVASKIASVAVLVAAMQAVLLALALGVGAALRVPGQLPWTTVAAAVLALVPAVAVAAWQSFLSMMIRGFAAPIAIALVACVLSFGALAAGSSVVKYLVAPATLSSTLYLGSTAVSGAGTLGVGTVSAVVAASAVSTVAAWLASVGYLRVADIRL